MKHSESKSWLWLAVLFSAGLSACSLTLPVQGQMETGEESFTGTATGYMDQSGVLEVTSNKGLKCSGDFVYVTSRQGRGVFRCSDGRSGPFEFVSTGTRSNGTGIIGLQRFTFTFG